MQSAKVIILMLFTALALSPPARAHVALDYPVGGETFTEGEVIDIQWHIVIPHDLQNWDLYFSQDGGSNWEVIELNLPPDQFNYLWTVPGIQTSQGRIRIYMDNTGPDYEDQSGDFTINLLPTFDVQVDLGNFFFDPVLIEIEVGQTVRWVNTVPTNHTTTALGGEWDSGDMGLDDFFDFTFDTEGAYDYDCTYHPVTMRGTVIVGDPSDIMVEIGDFFFEPADIQIDVGQTVRWVNTATTIHTTTALGGLWDSGDMGLSDFFDFTFESDGAYDYECTYHPVSMQGSVTVNAPGGSCSYLAGDVNHNGIPLELGDVIAMVSMFRGTVEPPYTCDCPPNGDDFAAEADPNGNCIPLELGDVIMEIGAFRGTTTASGCEDCPPEP
jgi:plastocyanin